MPTTDTTGKCGGVEQRLSRAASSGGPGPSSGDASGAADRNQTRGERRDVQIRGDEEERRRLVRDLGDEGHSERGGGGVRTASGTADRTNPARGAVAASGRPKVNAQKPATAKAAKRDAVSGLNKSDGGVETRGLSGEAWLVLAAVITPPSSVEAQGSGAQETAHLITARLHLLIAS
ncbi:unnamed protein product [Lampetra fluviatilis]